jgi:hypothetical protein
MTFGRVLASYDASSMNVVNYDIRYPSFTIGNSELRWNAEKQRFTSTNPDASGETDESLVKNVVAIELANFQSATVAAGAEKKKTE